MRRVRGELKGNLSNDTGPLKTGLALDWPLDGPWLALVGATKTGLALDWTHSWNRDLLGRH